MHFRGSGDVRRVTTTGAALLGAVAVGVASPARAQSLLDRPPNLSGAWVVPLGTVQFNFLHRFTRSSAPVRKVSNYPTFLIGVGLPQHTMIGFNYSTNSTLAPQYPNEWEFFGRWIPVSQDGGAPIDIGGQVGYNIAADGLDGELSLARRIDRVRVLGAIRVLSNPYKAGEVQVAFGGGATIKIGRYFALAGDVAALGQRDSARGEKVAWSGGLHLAIPNTPHTLSIQATNTNTATLQGASRGSAQKRYGFEFTIPFTLARYFGHQSPPPSAPADSLLAEAPPADSEPAAAAVFKTGMRNVRFLSTTITIAAGTTVVWTNNDPLAHTVTAVGSFDSGAIPAGGVYRRTFTKPGTYQFYCVLHPFMKGTVVVR